MPDAGGSRGTFRLRTGLIILLLFVGIARSILTISRSPLGFSGISVFPENTSANVNTNGRPIGNQRRNGNEIRFRSFTGNFSNHNRTVTGESIPGPFLNDRLFLIGARLSTSYDPNDTNVHVDVFGFAGDKLAIPDWCDSSAIPKNYDLMTFESIVRYEATMYCQLECMDEQSIKESFFCGDPIPMSLVPLNSGDVNQDDSIFIWRCNVSQYLTKEHLLQYATLNPQMSVRVRLEMSLLNQDSNEAAQRHYNVTTFDIPLHTAVIGHGGPQIRKPDDGYFSAQQRMQPYQEGQPLEIGLCVSIYSSDALHYIAEFVQHHKNIGISQIVVGMETEMDSKDLRRTRNVLHPFINEGFVLLQATGLKSFFSCDTDVSKQHFYHQCLYHYKGIAKYFAAWDLDEYWMPPLQLEVTGHSQFKYEVPSLELIVEADSTEPRNNLAGGQIEFINQSEDSSFSPLITEERFWQLSNYSSSLSIQDVLKAVETYYKQQGCDQQWCYHLFPSYTVYLRKRATRSHRIRDKFQARTSIAGESWKKSVARTQFAMMGGVHLPGSCKFPNDPEFYHFGKTTECYPHIWPLGQFGRLHHYMSLMGFRDDDILRPEDLVDDEYIKLYAATVYKQLKSLDRERRKELNQL